MDEKRSRGRPELPEGEGKDKTVCFRLKEDQRDEVERAAQIAGIKLSDWCRERLLSIARKEIKRAGKR